ncbi:prepilin-type N-terminal cleavage/methylation domain-containing protein [bacterium]|nr:prepilin-type N-terminal cleavage/methylation domain-containing protein [bacterium]
MIRVNDGATGSKFRPGYSLIEMLVVISVSVFLLSLMYSALVGVLRRTTEPDIVASQFLTATQATEILRDELRRSGAMQVDASGTSVQIEFEGSNSATWRLGEMPFRLERSAPGDKMPGIFGLTGFDSGRFERFETGPGRPEMLRLTLTPERPRRRSNAGPVEVRPIHFEFAVGTTKYQSKKDEPKAKPGEPKS